MFDELESRRAAFDRHRPFEAAIRRKLDELFEPWFIYSSNALEGNTLTYGDTVYLIREGRLPAGKKEEEYLEVKGQQDAYAYLQEAASSKFQLSEKLIKEFHTLLTRNLSDPSKYGPGQYKSRDNQVLLDDGTTFPYVPAFLTSAAMGDLVAWYLGPGQQIHPIERAAALHYRFILIHPFLDGNGRTARLLANFCLLQAGFVIAVFRMQAEHDRRRIYLNALRAVDGSVAFEEIAPDNPKINVYPLVSYLEQELLWSYDKALDVVEGRGATTADDLVRRFEKLEERSLAAHGIVADQIDQAKLLSERTLQLKELVHDEIWRIAGPIDKNWKHLAIEIGGNDENVAWLLEPLGFHALDPNARLHALGLRVAPSVGRVGHVQLAVKKRNDAIPSLFVPDNRCEFLVFAEPHRLILANLIGVSSYVEEWTSHRMDLPLDPAHWRKNDIAEFLAGQLNRFLEAVEMQTNAIAPPAL